MAEKKTPAAADICGEMLTYKEIKIEHIIEWCKENNEVAWLKEQSSKTFPLLDDCGQPILDKKGNPKSRKISFIEIKLAFARKYFAEIAPKKTENKKPTMYELIDAL